jgi:sugar/nucleoside kinase (ribokinase family)
MRSSPSWVVFGHLIIDDLYLPDGTSAAGRLGGAGTYAALGAALTGTGGVALVSGVGRDLRPADRAWLRSYGIDTTALAVRGDHTPRSRVRYFSDGGRAETPLLGEGHFLGMAPSVADLPGTWTTADGAYFFATHDAPQWPSLSHWVRERGCLLMWEISADSCRPEQFDRVAARLADVDILSINLAEARSLCGLSDPSGCVARLHDAGAALVVLRMGPDGAIASDTTTWVAAPAAPCDAVVDPTGAGNCYSGAFLAAYGRTRDLKRATARAAVAAASVLGSYGVPPPRAPTRAADHRPKPPPAPKSLE